MFQRDKELRAAGGADRARVLEKAKAERQARAAQRERDLAAQRLQRFVCARCAVRRARDAQRRDLDAKLADIARLKALLQRASLALPLDVVFELTRKLLFCYSARADDQSRLAALSLLFRDALAGGGDAAAAISDAQLTAARRWQLTWLVDVCLQASEGGGGSASGGGAPVALAWQVVDTFAAVRERVASRGVRVFSAREWQYARMEKVSLMELVRRQLAPVASAVVSHGSAGSGGDPGRRLFCAQLVGFAVHVATQSSALELPFVETVLSVPLLPDVVDDAAVVTRLATAPLWGRIVHATWSSSLLELPTPFTPGIPSITWLLGNLLWLSDRVSPAQQSSASMLDEVQMFTKLLQRVPAETFAPSGVAVSWTKVSESHSVPVVFPDALNDQLRVLVKERRVRQICDALIAFNPAGLRKPLATEPPTPMHPAAPTIHEQYGFGDIASSRSLQQSFSETWRRVKFLGRASWAKKLLEKSGLKKARESSESVSGARKSSLINTSALSRQLAEGDATSKLASSRRPPSERAFDLQSVYAVTQFFATFLARWPHHAKHNQVYQSASMNVINVLSFYKVSVPTTGSFSEEDGSIHLVTVLWSVLQEVKDFEAFAQDANLLHVDPNDGYIATLTLFCATYSHLLAVLDDEEMYDQEFPLPLHQLERIVVGFKHALHSAYWVYGLLPSQPGKSLESGMFLVDTATRLLTDLYSRCSRLPFCNASSWVLPGLDNAQLIDEILAGTPRANKLISSMPFVVSFPERVKLFQRLVEADKKTHQGDASNGTALAAYRVRIRRGAVLEDGLTKLNVIRGNLKKKINVVFVNAAGREEVGIDAGGLFKEFWLDLANLAFDLQYGLFLTTPNDQLLYPNPHAASAHFTRESDHLTLFQFVGRILGKALYEGIVVQPKFAQFFLSKLLHSFNHLSDLPSLDPEIYKNLMFLKSYDGDVEDLGLTFTVVQEIFGEQREIELLPNGAEVAVTNANRTRYVHLVANYYLNSQIRDQSAAFRAGLADLIDIRWLQLFNEPELQVLISGKSSDIDVPDLKAHTKYAGGYYALDKRVQWLWQALESFSPSERAAFLRFSTSCQRAPSLGFGALTPPFCIQKIPIRRDDELLPSSSTCFNTLKLPTYSSYRVLRAKLLVSISSGAGFEMT